MGVFGIATRKVLNAARAKGAGFGRLCHDGRLTLDHGKARLALASDRIVEMLEDLVTTVARIEAHFVLAHLVLVIAFRRPVINKNVVEREEGNEVAFTSVGVDVQSHERIHRFFRKAPDELHVSA